MALLETHVAHCGACGARIVFRVDYKGCYFVCYACGEQTTPRLTAAEADADVVWVPVVKTPKSEA